MQVQTVKRWVPLGLGLLWMVAAGSLRVRADDESRHRPTVRISVYNDAGLKHGILLRAEDNAGAIFRQAGIETEWSNCGGDQVAAQERRQCGEVAYPMSLVLRIRSRSQSLAPEAFGVAYLSKNGEGAYCSVFLEPMEELLREYAVSLDSVLGHVAAHEIAHLLLGPHSHSANGVMRAHWSLQTIEELRRGMLGFNAAQSAAMAERLEFAQERSPDALVTMAGAAPVTLTTLPARCPNAH